MTDDFSDEWLLLEPILDEWEQEQGDETIKVDEKTSVDALDISYIVRSRLGTDEITPGNERFYNDLGDLFFCCESQPDIREVWDVIQSHNERIPISELEIEGDPQEYRLDADDWCENNGNDVEYIDYEPLTEHIEGSQVHKKH